MNLEGSYNGGKWCDIYGILVDILVSDLVYGGKNSYIEAVTKRVVHLTCTTHFGLSTFDL